ncbi:hypothetical protein PHYPSEUDO_012544 [Phytophthora pseudosyringae]|uniref:Uncharacterized protein n=1 Tax=Phytophthora pseudosyringae TaxID=221518 RepID=A0A8T1V9D1_9STRA|nr:hypothetical protein PHYPSEUDO_012544 [Phytophthora pseudosyringae]
MSVVYTPESTQDVAVEIYALQPCVGRSTSLLMAPEMKQQHVKVYNKFNGVDEPATRDSKTLLADVGGKPVDESRTLPLLDITSFDVSQVTIHHILNYVYYKEGGRPQPAGMVFGESIYDEVNSQDKGPSVASQRPLTTSTGTEVVLSDGLSDSEDDEPVVGTPRRASRVMEPPEAKRRRRTAMGNEDTPRVRDPQVPLIPAADSVGWNPMSTSYLHFTGLEQSQTIQLKCLSIGAKMR